MNLTAKTRKKVGRNSGAYINIVFEDTPAFYANVMPGDIIVKLNDVDVKNSKHAIQVYKNRDKSIKSVKFTLLRDKKELVINVTPDK